MQAPSIIRARLLSMQDTVYRDFQCRLMPTVAPETVIGVRTPALRKMAVELAGSQEATAFLADLPHTYYEENNLHAFLVERISSFDDCLSAVEAFLPYVDNWATCDSFSPPVFKKNKSALLTAVWRWIGAEHTYTMRYGIGMLMRHFLDGDFSPVFPAVVAAVPMGEYYVHMMVAWYFATALGKQYDAVIPYLTERRLPARTHNATIQKAVESYRIAPEIKSYLKTLRIK